ncbi:phage portal protein [Nocardia wallacei]|uniref:phage portal protein n=1 Tax=Nocardia wallacei TaxID=480035 RepID=UPI00245469EA|nr:phage portal protein [Nocardia wallacei]
MPLPDANTPWPPRHLAPAFQMFSTCQVWWEGDAEKLSATHGEPARSGFVGLKDRIRRLFWGTKPDVSNQIRQIHIPIAADIVQTAASLLLPDPVAFRVAADDTDANDKARERVDMILNAPQMHSAMLQGAESGSALGGVYARIVWNASVKDHAWLDFVDADQAVPEFIYGELSAVTFWEVVDQNEAEDKVLRHLERHEAGYIEYYSDGTEEQKYGRIYHELYEGTAVSLGRPIDLAKHPETEGIPVNEEGYVDTGVIGLTAFYFPNALPNPMFRGKGTLRHFGRSDIGDPAVIGLMDQIDETYSSLARDVRLAKARLLVSEHLLEVKGPGKGTTFNVEQEVYEKVGGVPNGNPVIEAHQFAIRVDDHLRTGEGFLRAILRRVGFSPYTFGLPDDSGAAMTATEVDAKKDASTATFKTRSGIWKAVLARASRTLIEVDAAVFETGATLGQELEVHWPPAARESMQSKGQTLQALESAKAVSTEWKVRHLNPEYDDTAVAEEVARIFDEGAVADPLSLGADQPFPEADSAADEEPVDDTGDEQPADDNENDGEELPFAA